MLANNSLSMRGASSVLGLGMGPTQYPWWLSSSSSSSWEQPHSLSKMVGSKNRVAPQTLSWISSGFWQPPYKSHISDSDRNFWNSDDQHLQKFCKSLMSKIMEYNHQGFASAQIFVRAVCQVRRRHPMTSSVCWEKARVLRSDRLQTNCQCRTKTPKNCQYSPPPPKMPEENKTYRNLRPGGE